MTAVEGEAPTENASAEAEPVAPVENEARAPSPPAEEGRPLLVALRPLRALAVFACLVFVFARGVAPALQGAFVGVSEWIDLADLTASALTQSLALFVVLAVGALTLQLLRARAPLWLRLVGVSLSTLAVFAAITTIGVARMPAAINAAVAVSATLVALVFGVDAVRSAGLVGVVPVAVGLASLTRGVGAFIAERALAQRRDVESMRAAFHLAQVLSTVALFLLGLGFACALVVAFRRGAARLRAALGLGVTATLALGLRAASGLATDETPWGFLARRSVERLHVLPAPLAPSLAVGLVTVASPLVALALAAGAPRDERGQLGALALLVLAGASAEVPILGLCLVAGALGLALDRRDPNGVQAAVTPRLVA